MLGVRRSAPLAAAAMLATVWSGAVAAQTASEFYNGKTITIVIGYGPGGGFDTYARVFADHLQRHLPGVRTVVPQNMPGAGSMKAATYVYNVANQDGTVLGIFNENIPLNYVLEPKSVKFDTRTFQWIGRLGTRPTLGIAWHTTGVKIIQDATRKEVVMGSTGGNDYGSQLARALNAFVGTRFRPIHGYNGTKEIYLAIQREEVSGLNFAAADELTGSQSDWLEKKLVHVLHINGVVRLPEFPDVPTIVELAQNDEQRQIMMFLASKIEVGRSFAAGPKVPADRVAVLRQAFEAAVRDPALIADAKRRSVNVQPMSGPDLEKLIAAATEMPESVVEKMKAILSPR